MAYVIWKQLVVEHQVQGKTTHDTRIVAQMLAHGLDTLVTLNPKDFLRDTGLTVLTPEDTLKI